MYSEQLSMVMCPLELEVKGMFGGALQHLSTKQRFTTHMATLPKLFSAFLFLSHLKSANNYVYLRMDSLYV